MILAAPLYRGGRMARFHFVEGRENGATWWHEPHPLMTRQKPHVNGYRRPIRVATCPRLKKKLVLRWNVLLVRHSCSWSGEQTACTRPGGWLAARALYCEMESSCSLVEEKPKLPEGSRVFSKSRTAVSVSAFPPICFVIYSSLQRPSACSVAWMKGPQEGVDDPNLGFGWILILLTRAWTSVFLMQTTHVPSSTACTLPSEALSF